MVVVVFVWIVLGLIAGLVVSKRFHYSGTALAVNVTLGVAGAIAGGLAFYSLGFLQGTAVVAAGLLGAVAGSVVTLAGYRAIFCPV